MLILSVFNNRVLTFYSMKRCVTVTKIKIVSDFRTHTARGAILFLFSKIYPVIVSKIDLVFGLLICYSVVAILFHLISNQNSNVIREITLLTARNHYVTLHSCAETTYCFLAGIFFTNIKIFNYQCNQECISSFKYKIQVHQTPFTTHHGVLFFVNISCQQTQ